MGKQIAVAMTIEDEKLFLEFLKTTGEIQIIESSAPSIEKLYVKSFSSTIKNRETYYIWNRKFSWDPEYCQITQDKSGERQGWYFINHSAAPVIEYIRHSFVDEKYYGRIYWSKFFSAPDGLKYDIESFEKWFGAIVRWVRKNGKQKEKGMLNPFFLPDAWAKFGNKNI